jgi:hypothetical protein
MGKLIEDRSVTLLLVGRVVAPWKSCQSSHFAKQDFHRLGFVGNI